MRERIVHSADCSSKTLLRIAKRAGFVCFASKKHWKLSTVDGVFVTMIPRHERLKRELVKGIVIRMNEFGAEITLR